MPKVYPEKERKFIPETQVESEITKKMGIQGLFYYYHSMAKALRVYGEPVLYDANGNPHNRAEELASQLIKIQNKEDWWQNENGRWW